MIVFLADHVNQNARLVQYLWVQTTMKLILLLVLIAALAQVFAR